MKNLIDVVVSGGPVAPTPGGPGQNLEWGFTYQPLRVPCKFPLLMWMLLLPQLHTIKFNAVVQSPPGSPHAVANTHAHPNSNCLLPGIPRNNLPIFQMDWTWLL